MTKYGADISHHQASFNATTYFAAEDFIFMKATERADFTSPTFKSRWQACAGKPRGAYHFARPTGGNADADAEAAHFIKVVKDAGWRAGDTWVIDLEDNDGGLNASQLVAWSDRWCSKVRAALPSVGLFYSYIPFVVNTMGNPGRIPGGCLGWIARYRTDDPYAPIPGIANAHPKGWPDPPSVWQCSNGISGCVKNVASIGKCDYNQMTEGAFDVLFSGKEEDMSAADVAAINAHTTETMREGVRYTDHGDPEVAGAGNHLGKVRLEIAAVRAQVERNLATFLAMAEAGFNVDLASVQAGITVAVKEAALEALADVDLDIGESDAQVIAEAMARLAGERLIGNVSGA